MKKLLNINKKSLAQIVFLVAFVVVLAMPMVSLATCPPDCGTQTEEADVEGNTTITNPLGNTDTVNGLIKKILIGVIKIGIPLIAIMLVYTGFLYVMARGKPAAIETANQSLLYTLLGAAILLGSWAIAQLISNTVLQL